MRAPLARLADDRSGLALIEFALSLPLLIGLVMYGLEIVNLAYATQKIGDVATLTVDNVSRVRVGINEGDVTDTMKGLRNSAANISFAANGRIIVSSVMPVTDSNGNVTDQQIRWQRCTGALNQTSTYGVPGTNLGAAGMGPTGRKVSASANNEVIFVEVLYTYQPLISNRFLGQRTLRAIASMNVRDRSSNDIGSSGVASPCSTFSAT
jgi:Flp pilus assembly protein TadG